MEAKNSYLVSFGNRHQWPFNPLVPGSSPGRPTPKQAVFSFITLLPHKLHTRPLGAPIGPSGSLIGSLTQVDVLVTEGGQGCA